MVSGRRVGCRASIPRCALQWPVHGSYTTGGRWDQAAMTSTMNQDTRVTENNTSATSAAVTPEDYHIPADSYATKIFWIRSKRRSATRSARASGSMCPFDAITSTSGISLISAVGAAALASPKMWSM